MTGAAFGPLVSGEWLAARLHDVRVVDVRWYLDGRSGRAAYESGHVPGAVWIDLDADLAGPGSPADGRHPLPTPERFAAGLGRLGVAAGGPVVAYDDAGGSVAARLWWLLHVLGEPVAVLDGGIGAYPGELSTAEVSVVPVEREPCPWPGDRFVTADGLAATSAAVFDARTAQRYRDGLHGVDPRPGHVPGAHSAPWQDNLGPDGRFRPPAELAGRYRAAAGDGPAIAYCGSGVTACHDLLAMTVAGLEHTALYPGSWSQWGADPSRPTEPPTT